VAHYGLRAFVDEYLGILVPCERWEVENSAIAGIVSNRCFSFSRARTQLVLIADLKCLDEKPLAGLGEGFRNVPGEGSLPYCKCGGADLTIALSSTKTNVADLGFHRLPGVSFSVGSRTYTRCPFESVRHRNREIGVIMPPLPTSPSTSSSRLVFFFLL
jgi:hypothetical protein